MKSVDFLSNHVYIHIYIGTLETKIISHPHEVRQILDLSKEINIDSECLWCISFQVNGDKLSTKFDFFFFFFIYLMIHC